MSTADDLLTWGTEFAEVPALPNAPDEPADETDLRTTLTAKALLASHRAVAVITETFRANGADFDDAVRALPVLHRVLEHVERLEAARKTGTAGAVAILTIVLDDEPQVPPLRRRPAADVVDLTPSTP